MPIKNALIDIKIDFNNFLLEKAVVVVSPLL